MSWLRQESPPTFGRLVGAIGRALTKINRLEASNYFTNAGYAPTPTSNPL